MLRFALAFVGVALVSSGCTRTPDRCDDAQLEAVVVAMEGGAGRPAPEEYTTFAMRGLERACPSIPRELTRRLECSFGLGAAEASCLEVYGHEPTLALETKVCKDFDTALHHIAHDAYPEREQSYYDACEFRRFGLLRGGEEYWHDERFVWVAMAQMLDHKADPELTKRFARGMTHVGAPPEVLDDRCRRVTVGQCAALATAYGVELPRSIRWEQLPRPVNVIVTRERVELHGKAIEGLSKADVHGAGVAIFADVATPTGRIIDLVDDAERHGADAVGLVTASSSRDVGSMPAVTFEARRPALHLALASGRLQVRRSDQWEPGASLDDSAALSRLVKEAAGIESLTIDVDPELRLGDAVAAVARLDEARCAAQNSAPESRCAFSRVRFRRPDSP